MDMRCNIYRRSRISETPEGISCGERNKKKNLFRQWEFLRRIFLGASRSKRRYLWKGSLTIEAAVIVPMFLLSVCTLFLVFDLFRVQSLVKASISESAQELGMYAYAVKDGESAPVDIFSSVACASYAKAKLPELGKWTEVSLADTYVTEDRIYLIAKVTYKLPVSVIPLPSIHVWNKSSVRMWLGQQGEWDSQVAPQNSEMVYVTDYESVYHTSSECTYLDLAIHSCGTEEIENLRNVYGDKYKACSKCGSSQNAGSVFYTEKGDHYHLNENCSGLKRTMKLIPQSEVSHLLQCSRCQGREAA